MIMDFTITSIVIVVLTWIILLPAIKTYKKTRKIAHYIDKLPGEKKYPIVGTAWRILKTSRELYFESLKNRHQKFGPIFRDWLGSAPVVHIYKPEHAQVIFKSNSNVNKAIFYNFFSSWLGRGLISGSGHHWKRHRKLITPAFHFKMLDAYCETFSEKGEAFVKFLEQFDGKGSFEVTEHLTRLGIDVISETAMGVKLNFLAKQDERSSQYAEAIVGFTEIAMKRYYNPLLANECIFRMTKNGRKSQSYVEFIRSFTAEVIEKRKQFFKNIKSNNLQESEMNEKHRQSFLDMLLSYQETNSFDDEEIHEEVNTFMFAGVDTSVSTLTYSLLSLGSYPEVLKRAHEEVDKIFADNPNRKITPQDINRMEYLDRFIKEVLRYYSFVPFLARELQEDVDIDGTKIPKGTNVIIDIYDLHHDPEHYADPYKFDPDRFLETKRHPYAFVPFSAGPRNCLGQKFGLRNVKTILAYILRKYNVTCREKPEEIKYYLEIVLRPQNGLHIAIESR